MRCAYIADYTKLSLDAAEQDPDYSKSEPVNLNWCMRLIREVTFIRNSDRTAGRLHKALPRALFAPAPARGLATGWGGQGYPPLLLPSSYPCFCVLLIGMRIAVLLLVVRLDWVALRPWPVHGALLNIARDVSNASHHSRISTNCGVL